MIIFVYVYNFNVYIDNNEQVKCGSTKARVAFFEEL